MNYYNDVNPQAAAWLRQLIADKLIPEGYVDERSIVDVRGSDLEGYNQCHFFAGIGGWEGGMKRDTAAMPVSGIIILVCLGCAAVPAYGVIIIVPALIRALEEWRRPE